MSPFARGMLYGAGIVGAFAAGYIVNHKWVASSASVQPGDTKPAAHAQEVALGPTPLAGPEIAMPRPSVPPPAPTPWTPTLDLNDQPVADESSVPLAADPGFQLVKRSMGIDTTVLNPKESLPPVLVDAKRNELAADVPDIRVGPAPMNVPRLEAPPIIVPNVALQLINKRDISFDFEVTRIGLSKIAAVELWTTRDSGKTWCCTDKRSGCTSPFKTRLGSEGEYGFRLVFESESGMRTEEPAAGAKPDLRVKLDTTPPKVEFVRVTQAPNRPGVAASHLDHVRRESGPQEDNTRIQRRRLALGRKSNWRASSPRASETPTSTSGPSPPGCRREYCSA